MKELKMLDSAIATLSGYVKDLEVQNVRHLDLLDRLLEAFIECSDCWRGKEDAELAGTVSSHLDSYRPFPKPPES